MSTSAGTTRQWRAQGKKVIKKLKYSRLGCLNCKQRRLKCGEELDSCYNCLDKNMRCSYLDLTPEQKQKIIDSNVNNVDYQRNFNKTALRNKSLELFGKSLSIENAKGSTFQTLDVLLDLQNDARSAAANSTFGVNLGSTSLGAGNSLQLDDLRSQINRFDKNYSRLGAGALRPSLATGANENHPGSNTNSMQNIQDKPATGSSSAVSSSSTPTSAANTFSLPSKKRNSILQEPRKDIANKIRNHSSFGIIDFKSNSHTNTSSTNFKAGDHPINHTKKNFNPLPHHLYQLTSFKINKINLVKYPYSFVPGEPFTVCGEDEVIQAYIREVLTFWLTDANYNGQTSPLLFEALMSRSILLILVNIQKACYKHQRQESYELILLLKRLFAPHRIKGLQEAQYTIEALNQPTFASKFEYLRYFKNLVHYSLINIGLTLQSDKDYLSLVAFINGFISSSLSIETFEKLRDALSWKLSARPVLYAEFRFTELIFSHIRGFFLKNIASMYISSYHLKPLAEFYKELLNFKKFLKKNQTVLLSANPVALSQLEELRSFLEVRVLENRNLLDSFDPNFVTAYNIKRVFEIMNVFFDEYPPEVVFFQATYTSMSTIDKIIYLHWIATACLLDNIFPEAIYFFTAKFAGGIHWAGYNMKLIDSIFEGLERNFKQQRYSLYDALYRKTIYLTRLTSFFAHRHRALVRNLLVTNPYPAASAFDEFLRLQSRKPKFIKETQKESFLRGAIELEHYAINDPGFVQPDSPSEALKPSHPNNVCYVDTNIDVNKNTDDDYYKMQQFLNGGYNRKFDISDFPLDLMKLSEFGLIKNVDYRPDLNTVNRNYLTDDNEYFAYDDPDSVLKHYATDKDMIICYLQRD